MTKLTSFFHVMLFNSLFADMLSLCTVIFLNTPLLQTHIPLISLGNSKEHFTHIYRIIMEGCQQVIGPSIAACDSKNVF